MGSNEKKVSRPAVLTNDLPAGSLLELAADAHGRPRAATGGWTREDLRRGASLCASCSTIVSPDGVVDQNAQFFLQMDASQTPSVDPGGPNAAHVARAAGTKGQIRCFFPASAASSPGD